MPTITIIIQLLLYHCRLQQPLLPAIGYSHPYTSVPTPITGHTKLPKETPTIPRKALSTGAEGSGMYETIGAEATIIS